MSHLLDRIYPKFIFFIIFVKFLYVIFSFLTIYFDVFKLDKSKMDFIKKWKERMDFLFTASMSILLIILFNPWHKNEKYMNEEVKLLLYVFGFILLTTANWQLFLEESPWFKNIVQSFN